MTFKDDGITDAYNVFATEEHVSDVTLDNVTFKELTKPSPDSILLMICTRVSSR